MIQESLAFPAQGKRFFTSQFLFIVPWGYLEALKASLKVGGAGPRKPPLPLKALKSPFSRRQASVQVGHAPAARAVAVHCGHSSFRRGSGCAL